MRWWTPGYVLTIAETYDDKGGLRSKPRPVGFTWWHRPQESLTFRERWLTIRELQARQSERRRTDDPRRLGCTHHESLSQRP